MEKTVDLFYQPDGPAGRPFAEMLARARQRIAEQGQELETDLALAIQAKLRTDFPNEC